MKENRVVVAMSGGVDSSLTAALLKERGYEVIGVTMEIWPSLAPEEEARRGGCCSLAAVEDARRVAATLDIPYYVLNLRNIFETRVIDYFCREYARGRTPNPCIACNQFVKFEALLEKAFALDAHFVATGHYAVVEHAAGQNGRHLLRKSADRGKDQTYVLYSLRQEQLAHLLMPLGVFTKKEVRRLAAERHLATAGKPESQEICFVIDGDYGALVEDRLPDAVAAGPIYDLAGNRIGTHRGLARYTYGQRRGLGLSAGRPMYVVDIRPEENALVVGPEEELLADGLTAFDVNWIPFELPEGPLQARVKIRYRSPEVEATVYPEQGSGVWVRFANPQKAVTPGQAVVFYQGNLVLGGGVINEPLRTIDGRLEGAAQKPPGR